MNNFFYIGSRLSKITPEDSELQKIRECLSDSCKSEQQQNDFFDYCVKWKIAPWMYTQFIRFDLDTMLSAAILQKFEDLHNRIKTENENRNNEALNFIRRFNQQNIDMAVLKGNLFIHTVYYDTGYKKMNDFDMLIHQKHWPAIQKIYFDLNYIPLGFGWSGEKQEVAKFSHAGMSFISRNYHCITGTQWGLKSPTSKYRVNADDIWESCSNFDFYGEPVKKLSPEYNLLHLVLHMGIYKCGIRDCMDVSNLLLSEKTFDEDKFVAIAKKSNAIDKSYFTLKLTDICSNSVSASLLEKLKSRRNSYIIRRLKARLKMAEKSGDFQLSYNDYFHDIEMDAFYFNLFPEFHKRFNIYFSLLRKIIWPEKLITLKLSDLDPNASLSKKITARIKAPYLTFGLLAEEIGLGISFLLMVKLGIDLILSLKNYFVKNQSYFDYLKGLGVNPDDIKKVVKQIQ